MELNPQKTADLGTFTEEIHNGNLIFCAVYIGETKKVHMTKREKGSL